MRIRFYFTLSIFLLELCILQVIKINKFNRPEIIYQHKNIQLKPIEPKIDLVIYSLFFFVWSIIFFYFYNLEKIESTVFEVLEKYEIPDKLNPTLLYKTKKLIETFYVSVDSPLYYISNLKLNDLKDILFYLFICVSWVFILYFIWIVILIIYTIYKILFFFINDANAFNNKQLKVENYMDVRM